eukprot:9032817-Heterocapsa_arctica.AAC.1
MARRGGLERGVAPVCPRPPLILRKQKRQGCRTVGRLRCALAPPPSTQEQQQTRGRSNGSWPPAGPP